MPALARARHARPGRLQVSEVQRARMLHAAVRVVSEVGYQQMSVARVTSDAGVSRRTFYDVFRDREDCFLAAFELALARARDVVAEAYAHTGGRSWAARVRGALLALLVFLEEEPEIARLLVIDALSAGPRVLARRAEALRETSVLLGHLDTSADVPVAADGLVGDALVGAVFGLIHSRLTGGRQSGLVDLLGPAMALIVLPYRGQGAARRELELPVPERPARRPAGPLGRGAHASEGDGASEAKPEDPLATLPMRVTYRTMRVLSAVAGAPGSSNRTIGTAAGVSDPGQISKLLGRLEKLGLMQNTAERGHPPTGEPNAWRLTTLGEQLAHQLALQTERPDNGAASKATTKRRTQPTPLGERTFPQ